MADVPAPRQKIIPTPTAPYLCSSTPEYTFCAPQRAGGDFYIAVGADSNLSPSADVQNIQTWMRNPQKAPEFAAAPPEGLALAPGARLYRVNALLPPFVVEKQGTSESIVGSNCYQGAFSSDGCDDCRGRYLHTEEVSYRLKRDYVAWACSVPAAYGAIAIYDRGPMPYDAGEHAAYVLLGGPQDKLVFQKGGWPAYYPYEIAPMREAMAASLSHWKPDPKDRFGTPRPPSSDGYEVMCYRRNPTPPARAQASTAQDLQWFLPLFEYYGQRLRKAETLSWGDFQKGRIDLLTIENVWRILADFRKRIGMFDMNNVLLGLDDRVAEGYLRLESLDWQYQAMVEAYDPIKEWSAARQLEELYRQHYVTIDGAFREELGRILSLWKVPDGVRDDIAAEFVKRIQAIDPVPFAQSNGAQGIPYFDLLIGAVQVKIPGWRPPAGFGDRPGAFGFSKDRRAVDAPDRSDKPFVKRRHARI